MLQDIAKAKAVAAGTIEWQILPTHRTQKRTFSSNAFKSGAASNVMLALVVKQCPLQFLTKLRSKYSVILCYT